MLYPSGNYYEGEWAYEKKEGYGTTHWVNSKEKVTLLIYYFKITSIMDNGKIINNLGLECIYG